MASFKWKFLYFEESFQVMLPYKVFPPTRLFADIKKINLVRLRIRDIFVRIRIRIRILGSAPLTNGSGCLKHRYGSESDANADPDPEHWYIYIILQRWKNHKEEIKVFFLVMLDDGRIRSRFRTCDYNVSGCESGRPKNIGTAPTNPDLDADPDPQDCEKCKSSHLQVHP